MMYNDEIVLEWHQRQYQRTIKLDEKGSNTGWIFTAPGYSRYHAFLAEVHEDVDDYSLPLAYQSTMVTDDEFEPESDDKSLGEEQLTTSEEDAERQDPLATDIRMEGPEIICNRNLKTPVMD